MKIEIVNCSKCMVMPVITRPTPPAGVRVKYLAEIRCPVCGKFVRGASRGEKSTQRDADTAAIEEWNAHELEH